MAVSDAYRAPEPDTMHPDTAAMVETGSLNSTDAAEDKNAEYGLVLNDPAVAQR